MQCTCAHSSISTVANITVTYEAVKGVCTNGMRMAVVQLWEHTLIDC